ncbi:MAG: hypothetical protein IJJ33_13950 [Victivallales bacterium]|nr:hypothetical protein [Victivallales bacterium]MBQ6473083.1 hypothetical protein [Victivallales bacterium]
MNTIFNIYDVADHLAQASLPDGTKWLYGYHGIGNRMDAQKGSSTNQ